MQFLTWQEFLEAKEEEKSDNTPLTGTKKPKENLIPFQKKATAHDLNNPPTGSGSNPYMSKKPKDIIRSVEKHPSDALADKYTPPFNNPKEAQPMGEKPDYSNVSTESVSESFMNETRNLSTEDFINFVLNENEKKKTEKKESKKKVIPTKKQK